MDLFGGDLSFTDSNNKIQTFVIGHTRETIDARKQELENRQNATRGFVQEGQELSRWDKFLGRIGRAVSFDHK